jgi:hypothetical protein
MMFFLSNIFPCIWLALVLICETIEYIMDIKQKKLKDSYIGCLEYSLEQYKK